MTPEEIIAAPATVWIAPVGESFTDVQTATPTGSWVKIGTAGDRNYGEDGVAIEHAQTIEHFTPLGATGPVKAFRTAEGLMLKFTLNDLSLEQYKHAMNENTVTELTDTRTLGLSRGLTVQTRALMIRFPSPYDNDLIAQYEIPVAYESGSPAPAFTKGTAAGLALEFTALEDPNASSEDERFGRLVADDGAT